MKIIKQESPDKKEVSWMFWCFGCGHHHAIPVESARRPDMVWQFNGNLENPSFTPSLLNRFETLRKGSLQICHLFVTDGKIQYCSDCTHSYAGKTVEMREAIKSRSDT